MSYRSNLLPKLQEIHAGHQGMVEVSRPFCILYFYFVEKLRDAKM